MTEFGDKNDGISRRDFLDGVAISAAGLAAAAAAPDRRRGARPFPRARARPAAR